MLTVDIVELTSVSFTSISVDSLDSCPLQLPRSANIDMNS